MQPRPPLVHAVKGSASSNASSLIEPDASSRLLNPRGGPAAIFAAFLVAADASTILESFKQLLEATRTPPNSGCQMLSRLREALLDQLQFRQRKLLHTLHARATQGEYATAAGAVAAGSAPLKAMVLGGGPIGLRCAIELAMLGHSVLALEQRTEFGRLNILHLWDWVANDLAELGIKDLDPSIFASGDYLHCGTSQLQHSLLKIALLVGVQVRLGANVRTLADLRAVEPHQARTTSRRSLEWPADVRLSLDNAPGVPPLLQFGASSDAVEGLADGVRGMHLSVDGRPLPTLQVQQRRRSEDAVFNADVLVDATGARCELFRTIGFEQVTALKSARALGVVVHFHNRKTPTENALEEKNWAQQYHKARFEQLKERGVQLQNLVYYRSTGAFSEVASHYFVMTAESGSLRAMGALRSTDVPEWQLCQSANVDRAQLEAFVRIAVSEFVPALADAELVAKQGVQIFDFSERKVSNKASVLLDATRLHGAPGAQVLVTRVGDALQEPFWVRRWLPIPGPGSCYLLLTNHAGGSIPVPTARGPRH